MWRTAFEDGSVASVLLVVTPLLWATLQIIGIVRARCHLDSGIYKKLGVESSTDGEQQGTDRGRMLTVLADPCRPVGSVAFNNEPEALAFECDAASGCVLMIHRPTCDPGANESGMYPYGDHMHGRRRLWEARWQLTFRRKVDGQVFLGLEQDKYMVVKWAQRVVAGNVLAVLRRTSGGAMYHSYGDDPTKVKGELERPTVVFPVSVIDQLIITPEGEPPPRLSDPLFPTWGITKSNDRKAFRAAVDTLELVPGPTYTFAFWALAQFADAIGWRAPARGLLPEVPFRDIGIRPPCFFAMYSLPRGGGRHLDSRKSYLLRMAYWSTLSPPEAARAEELLSRNEAAPVTPRKSVRRGRVCCF